jgi:hypothetical protein
MSGKLKVKGDIMKGELVEIHFAVPETHSIFLSDEDGAYTRKGTDEGQVVELLGLDHNLIPF